MNRTAQADPDAAEPELGPTEQPRPPVISVSMALCLLPAEDVMMETVVEVSTECGPIEEDAFPIAADCEPAAKKKRGGEFGPADPANRTRAYSIYGP